MKSANLFKMIEVEAKIRIENPKEFRKKAAAIARFKGIEKKTDDYYTLDDLSHYPEKSLRIRKHKNKYEINFKTKISYESGIHSKKETEFTASNISDFLALINDFGFRHWLRKEKISEVYELEKNFHIEINNVKNLGWFLEIEYLAKPSEIDKAQKKILAVFEKLGINHKHIIREGYTKMLWDKGLVSSKP